MKKDLEQQIYFEDMEIGDKVVSVGRTITEADIVSFAGLTGDYNTLHTDAEFAKGSIAGQRLAHGMLPLTYSSGLFTRTSYNQAMMAQMAALPEIKTMITDTPLPREWAGAMEAGSHWGYDPRGAGGHRKGGPPAGERYGEGHLPAHHLQPAGRDRPAG